MLVKANLDTVYLAPAIIDKDEEEELKCLIEQLENQCIEPAEDHYFEN